MRVEAERDATESRNRGPCLDFTAFTLATRVAHTVTEISLSRKHLQPIEETHRDAVDASADIHFAATVGRPILVS